MIDSFRKLPSSIQALGLTALAYIAAFTFQFGYLHYFDISYRAIEISIPILITSLAVVIYALFSFDQVATLYTAAQKSLRNDNSIHRFLKVVIRAIVFLFFIFVFWYAMGTKSYWAPLFLGLIVVLGLVVEPLPDVVRSKSISKGLEAMFKWKDDTSKNDIINYSYFVKYAYLFISALIILVIALLAGKLYADLIKNVYVVNDHGSIKTVLLQKNGDTLVTRDFDTRTKKFLPGFSLQKVPNKLNLSERVKIAD